MRRLYSFMEQIRRLVSGIVRQQPRRCTRCAASRSWRDLDRIASVYKRGEALEERVVLDAHRFDPVVVHTGSPEARFRDVLSVGDLNFDGYQDVLASIDRAGLPTQVTVIYGAEYGLGKTVFADRPQAGVSTFIEADSEAIPVDTGEFFDFNGNVYGDFALADPSGGEDSEGVLYVLFGTPVEPRLTLWNLPTTDPTFGTPRPSGFAIRGGHSNARIGSAVAAGDFNGDGYSDLALGDAARESVFVVFGRPDHLGAEWNLSQLTTTQNERGVELRGNSDMGIGQWLYSPGDLDGDGFEDLLVGVNGTQSMQVMWGSRGALQVSEQALPGSWDHVDRHAADINQDGLSDIAFAGDGVIDAVLFGNDNRTFPTEVVSVTQPRPVPQNIGDINGDGYLDTVMISENGRTLNFIHGTLATQTIPNARYAANEPVNHINDAVDFISTTAQEVLIGARGRNSYKVDANHLPLIDGGNRQDYVEFTAPIAELDLTQPDRQRIKNVETLSLEGNGPTRLILTPQHVASLSKGLHSLYVLHDADDEIVLSPEWEPIVVETPSVPTLHGTSIYGYGAVRVYFNTSPIELAQDSAGLSLSTSVSEISDAQQQVIVTASLAEPRSLPTLVRFSFDGSTAVEGRDFDVFERKVVIAPGETRASITLTSRRSARRDKLINVSATVPDEPARMTLYTDNRQQPVSFRIRGTDGTRDFSFPANTELQTMQDAINAAATQTGVRATAQLAPPFGVITSAGTDTLLIAPSLLPVNDITITLVDGSSSSATEVTSVVGSLEQGRNVTIELGDSGSGSTATNREIAEALYQHPIARTWLTATPIGSNGDTISTGVVTMSFARDFIDRDFASMQNADALILTSTTQHAGSFVQAAVLSGPWESLNHRYALAPRQDFDAGSTAQAQVSIRYQERLPRASLMLDRTLVANGESVHFKLHLDRPAIRTVTAVLNYSIAPDANASTSESSRSITVTIPIGSRFIEGDVLAHTDAFVGTTGNPAPLKSTLEVTQIVGALRSGVPNRDVWIAPTAVPEVEFLLQKAIVPEGESIRFTASLAQPQLTETVLRYQLDTSAASFARRANRSGIVRIPAGETSAQVLIPTNYFDGEQSDEHTHLRFTLSGSAYPLVEPLPVTIIDAPNAIELRVFGNVTEDGSQSATIVGRLRGREHQDVVIRLNFSGTAAYGVDYTADQTMLVIPAGQLVGRVTLRGTSDAHFELTETIEVTGEAQELIAESWRDEDTLLMVTQPKRAIELIDSNPVPMLYLVAQPEAGEGSRFELVVKSRQAADFDIRIPLLISGSVTAEDVVDDRLPTEIVLPAGATRAFVFITLKNDGQTEGPETLVVTLGDLPLEIPVLLQRRRRSVSVQIVD